VLPEGQEADVALTRRGGGYLIGLRGFDLGFVTVGSSHPAATGPGAGGGAVGTCGAGGVVPLGYEGIRRVDRDTIELTWARGFLDRKRCRAAVVERHVSRAAHVAGGVVYAFRTRCAACAEGAREVLHVLTPQSTRTFGSEWTPFEDHALPLGPGLAGAFQVSTRFRSAGWSSALVPDWEAAIDRRCGSHTTWCSKQVRVEVSQARGEMTPTLFVSGDVAPE
jgi:hypothetical protein